MSKQGQVGLKWILIIFALFAGGLGFLMLNYVWTDFIIPTGESLINSSISNSTIATSIEVQADKWTAFWDFTPWLILFFGVIFVIVMVLKKEEAQL